MRCKPVNGGGALRYFIYFVVQLVRAINKGVAERGSRTKGWKGGVRPKAEKKNVTSPILMAEVVIDVPKGTSDGSTGVQVVFELL